MNLNQTTDGDRTVTPITEFPRRRRRTEKVSEVIAREILHDIVDRRLQPGATLPPESQMLSNYRVGRASLREALRILEIQGLITIKPGPGGGPVVAGAHSQDLGRMATMYFHASRATFRELLEARLVMEPTMARHAAERQDPQFLTRLEEVIRAQAAQIHETDDLGYQQAATDFHDLVAGMSGNRILDLLGRSLKDIYLDRVRELHFPPEERDRIVKMHQRVAKAIFKADGPRAERLMREHMLDYAGIAAQRFPGIMDEIVDWR